MILKWSDTVCVSAVSAADNVDELFSAAATFPNNQNTGLIHSSSWL